MSNHTMDPLFLEGLPAHLIDARDRYSSAKEHRTRMAITAREAGMGWETIGELLGMSEAGVRALVRRWKNPAFVESTDG